VYTFCYIYFRYQVDAEFSVLPGLQDAAPEGKSWIDIANEHVAVIPQIESHLGVENLEIIMQVEGVDAISMYIILTCTDFRHDTFCLGT